MDSGIIDSWRANADAWTDAVRSGRIESRRVATDAAVVAAVLKGAPRRVLDVGCGEGSLSRQLAAAGVECVGFDVSDALVDAARIAGGGTFHRMSYAELIEHPHSIGTGFDAVLFNFSLFEQQIAPLLRAAASIARDDAAIVIQTLHPLAAPAPYADGWREETFASLGPSFPAPMPWYFRTLSSWVAAVGDAGLCLAEVVEPRHPVSGELLSLVLVCRRRT